MTEGKRVFPREHVCRAFDMHAGQGVCPPEILVLWVGLPRCEGSSPLPGVNSVKRLYCQLTPQNRLKKPLGLCMCLLE